MARWTAERGWPLFKIRPKCHLFGHILLLGIFSIPRFKGLGFRVVLIKLKKRLATLRRNMETQIQCAAADDSLPQYCLNAICHLAASNNCSYRPFNPKPNADEALPHGAMKIWWAG